MSLRFSQRMGKHCHSPQTPNLKSQTLDPTLYPKPAVGARPRLGETSCSETDPGTTKSRNHHVNVDVDGFLTHAQHVNWTIQGYLAHKKPPPPLEPREGSRHSPTVGSYGEAVSLWARYPCSRSTECGRARLPRAARKVDVRLPGKGDSNSHGARPVRLIITMIKLIRTSRLSAQNSLDIRAGGLCVGGDPVQ